MNQEANAPSPTTGAILRRAASAEWARLWTVRSTWFALLAAAALMLFVGAAAGSGHEGAEAAPVWYAAQFAIVPAQFAFLLIVVLAVTSEYTTGAIRSTLQWTPRRGILLAARIIVPTGIAALLALVLAAATDLVAWGFLGADAEVVANDIAASLAPVALVVAFGSALSIGIGLLLRSTAGTLTTIFLLIFALPIALGNIGVSWLTTISDYLPGRAIVSLVVLDEVELPTNKVALVMIGWTLAALLAGGWSLTRRDPT